MYLFFDTETTGLPVKGLPITGIDQPRICQIAAIETDGTGRTMTEINFLIRPSGWMIPEQASAIHGITQEVGESYGLRIEGALSIMRRLVTRSLIVVAHNIEFDSWMLRREAALTSDSSWTDLKPKSFCTMEKCRDILKIPPTAKMAACGMKEFKRPNLQEAFRHFFGREFEGAHDAMADVRACKDVFFALQKVSGSSTEGAAA